MASVGGAVDPFGDFQTPEALASRVWPTLDLDGIDLFLEPTVGEGSFLATVPERYLGVPWRAYDIRPAYVEAARAIGKRRGLTSVIACKDVFTLAPADLGSAVADKAVLVVGNPPWVTSSSQSASEIRNLPKKLNRFGLKGLDALTGKSNFDLAEAIVLAVLDALALAREIRLALLVKRSVALKMARDLLGGEGLVEASFARIDAKKWFDASVEAGLLRLTFKPGSTTSIATISIAEAIGGPPAYSCGYVGDRFVGDVDAYRAVRHVEAGPGRSLPWRQGIKHDLSKVLELKSDGTGLVNGYGDPVDIEPDALCPLFKSSDIAAGRGARRWMPLYQHDLSGPLPDLKERWPKLHRYLSLHRDSFDARGSSIYKDKPEFMLFGVGPYTLAPFKVALSGFYKSPNFRLLRPDDTGNPPLVDDTCYMLPFDDEREARAVVDYLNGDPVQSFLLSIADVTAKRPFTKGVLGRIAAPLEAGPAADGTASEATRPAAVAG